MSSPTYRLSETTLVEPLVDGWHAWWMNVSPFCAALNLASAQIPALQSYLKNPTLHANASKDPSLQGTAFVGVDPAQAGQVQALLERHLQRRPELLLAEAIDGLQARLLLEARGQALEALYREVPAPLRGLVELTYDYFNRPMLRLMEGAGYRSSYYRADLQSFRLSRYGRDEDRPSVVATPRVEEPGQVGWNVPFASPQVDALFGLDLRARPLEEIRALLGLQPADDARLLPLLTPTPVPPPAPPAPANTVRIRYLGHACILLEWRGKTVLVDPLLAPHPAAGGPPRLTFSELPERIDYAVVTHTHHDHFALDTLLRLRHRIGELVLPKTTGMLTGDVSLRLMARTLGFPKVTDLDHFESLPLPDGELISIPFLGEHGDIAHSKSAWLLRAGEETILLAADSACLDPQVYQRVRDLYGPVETVFMNTETEGSPLTFTVEPLFPKRRDRKLERDRRCRGSNTEEGLRLLEVVGAKRVFNYAMGLEPWVAHIVGPPSPDDSLRMRASDALLTAARERGLVAQRLRGPTQLLLPDSPA